MKHSVSACNLILRILTIIATFARLFFVTSEVYADSLAFNDWGAEIANLDQYQALDNAQVMEGQISALDGSDSFLAIYQVDVNSITDAIEAAEARLDFGFDCSISEEGDSENDSAEVAVLFEGSGDNQSYSCDVNNQGAFSDSLAIPAGTTAIQFTFTGTLAGSTNTVNFAGISIVIEDDLAPRLGVLSTPELSGGANVGVTVEEFGSGLSGVYYAAGELAAEDFPESGTELTITDGSGSFFASESGYYTVYAADLRGNTNLEPVYVNTYPNLTGLADQSTSEDNPVTFSFTVSDAETASGNLTINAASSDQTIVQNSGIALLNTDGTVAITVYPVADAHGDLSITFRVTDEGGLFREETIQLGVEAVNDVPVANPDRVTTDEDTPVEINVLENDENPDQGLLTVELLGGPESGGAMVNESGTITYTPPADLSGSDHFTYQITDSNGGDTASAEVIVTINSVNDYPKAVDDSGELSEDGSLSISVLDNDNDVEGDAFSIISYTQPTYGTVELNADLMSFTYIPYADYFGSDAFTYTIQENAHPEVTATANVNLTINGVNDAPVPSYTAAVSTDEDTPLTEALTATDVELEELSYSKKTEPSHGTLELIEGGYTYTPAANYNGPDSFVITISDGTNYVDCEITVTVNAINDAPVPSYTAAVSTDEDTPLTETLTATDVELEELSYSKKTEPEHGTLELIEGGYTYTPAANYNGPDSFVITVSDGTNYVDCEITMTVNAVNDAPVPSYTAAVSTDEDTPLTEALTATDVELEELSYSKKTEPSHGTLELIEGGYTYTPADDFNGPDSFVITVSDGMNYVDCEITVTVNAVNDAPVPSFTAAVSTDEDTPLTEALTATDVELEELSYSKKTEPSHGTLELIEGGYTYTPADDFNGPDSFVITVSDGTNYVDCEITVTVNAVNDAPVPSYTAAVSTDEDTPLTEALTATDVELEELSYTKKTEPEHGTLELVEDGYTYTPADDYNGPDSFTITVSDGMANVDCVITMTVNAINDAPVPSYTAAVSTDEDNPLTETLTATDVDLDELGYTKKTEPEHGTLELVEDGYTYTPADDYNGPDSFTITVSDGMANVDCVITMTVNAINDAPVPSYTAAVSTDEDNPLTETLTATDVDLDELGYNKKTEPEHGTLELIEGGYTYTPADNYNGPDSFTITVSDGMANVDCVITMTVNAVNDAPVPSYTAVVSTDEDTPLTETLTATDVDLDDLSYAVKDENQPTHGSLELIEGGYTYKPNTNYNGNDNFIITVGDGTTEVDCEIAVTVNAVNDSPVAVDDSASTSEDTPITISVLANDSDVDSGEGDSFAPTNILSGPSHGNATITGTTIYYEPAENYYGSDEFTYEITDSGGLTASAAVSVTISSVNDYPQPYGLLSEYTIDEDNSITISFNLSDVETPPETLTMQVVSGNTALVPQTRITISGLEDTNPAVSIKLVPLGNQNGDVTFTIRASDGFQTAVYTFTLHVTPVNDAPTARNDSISFTEDTPTTITISSQMLNNDVDVDNNQGELSYDGIVTTTTSGTLVDNEDGTLTYAPSANYDSTDSFVYRIKDPDGATSTATVTLTASAVNDTPIISTIDDQTIDEDGTLTVNFTVEDYDLDTEAELNTLMITTSSTNPDILDMNNMRITGSGNNRTFTAAPLADKNGEVTVTITVSDGITEVSEVFVVIINPVPDAPTAVNDFFYVQETGSYSIDPVANDWDADGDTDLTPTIVSTPSHGSLTADGTAFIYTAGEDFVDGDSFTYTVTDSTDLVSEPATVTLSADPENHPPEISVIDKQIIFEDETGSISFTIEDVDENLEDVTVTSSNTTLFPESSLVLDNSGANYTLDMTPAENANGKAVLTIRAEDSRGNTTTRTFTVRVVPINDAPMAIDDIVVTNEDSYVVFNVISNDTDIETATANLILRKVLSTPSHGRLTSLGSGQFRYTPYGDFNGTDSFTYEMIDADGGVASATVNITINSVNDAPEAYDNNLTTIVAPGGTLDNINVIGNDTDPDLPYDPDEEIHVTRIVSQPACGTAYVNGDGTVKYEAFDGGGDCSPAWVTFTYEIEDHYGATDVATVSNRGGYHSNQFKPQNLQHLALHPGRCSHHHHRFVQLFFRSGW